MANPAQAKNLWAVVVCVVVRVEHGERSKQSIHSSAHMMQPHFIAICEWHCCSGESQVAKDCAYFLVSSLAYQVLVGARLRLVQKRLHEILC